MWGVVAQSPKPRAHVWNAQAFRIELEFRNVGFCGEGKTGVPGEKPLGAEKRTNNKLNPHMTSSPGIEPGPHWWKASALTTAPSLLPKTTVFYKAVILQGEIWYWSLLGLKGLKAEDTNCDPAWKSLQQGSKWNASVKMIITCTQVSCLFSLNRVI